MSCVRMLARLLLWCTQFSCACMSKQLLLQRNATVTYAATAHSARLSDLLQQTQTKPLLGLMCSKGPTGFGPHSDFYILALVGWTDSKYNEDGIGFSKWVSSVPQ